MLADLVRANNSTITQSFLGHENPHRVTIRHHDIQAIAELAADLGGGVRLGASQLRGQMRYDGVDWSEFQYGDPEWGDLSSMTMLVARLCDGSYKDPYWEQYWQGIQSQPARYKGFYVLPDPRVGWRAQGDYAKRFYDRAGVDWGKPGHFYSIDDEPTQTHGQITGSEMRSLRSYLEDIFQREELHYVGLYNGNYGFIQNEGWKLWAPWPIGNGSLPSWTTNFTAWQWGVAGPGEVPGFRNRSVDVNMVMDTDAFDRLAGYTGGPTPTTVPSLETEMMQQALSDPAQGGDGTLWFFAPNGDAWPVRHDDTRVAMEALSIVKPGAYLVHPATINLFHPKGFWEDVATDNSAQLAAISARGESTGAKVAVLDQKMDAAKVQQAATAKLTADQINAVAVRLAAIGTGGGEITKEAVQAALQDVLPGARIVLPHDHA